MSFSRRFLSCVLSLSALGIFSAPVSLGQLLQGTIDGNVTDPSQGAVAGATVTVSNEGTKLSRDTVTNSQGEYTLPTLPPGTYTLAIKAGGFGPYSQAGVMVNANEVTRVNVALLVGQLSQHVTVSAQSATLQPDRADVHTDVTTKSLTDLPTP